MQNNHHNQERIQSDLILLLAAFIWGAGFVAQRSASFHLGFFAFNGIRFLLGGLALLPFVIGKIKTSKKELKWIIPPALILFCASSMQQLGISTTTAGTAGFITGIYVILVPVLLSLIWKQKARPIIWVAAIAALFGTYLLSTGGSRLSPSSGNYILLIGSVLWAFHVIVVGFSVKKLDALVFSVGQFLLVGVMHLVSAFLFDPPTAEAVRLSWLSLLYAGLCSVAIGFTLQAVGQRKAPPADAALILSLESVFAAIAGALLLDERMNLVQIIGSAVIMIAIVVAQLPIFQQKSNDDHQKE